MICHEIPRKTLDDEITRLQALINRDPPGKSYVRMKARAAVAALRWLRDGTIPPSVKFGG